MSLEKLKESDNTIYESTGFVKDQIVSELGRAAFTGTVFEQFSTVVDTSSKLDNIEMSGPTSSPTYMGGQFMGIDSDYGQ